MRAFAEQSLMPSNAFEALLGAWQLKREVRGQALVEGVLTIRETRVGEAEYSERVAVKTAGGVAFSASQRYLVKRLDDGFALYFAEAGALFEEVRFGPGANGALRAEAAHCCGQDWYRSVYELGSERQFTIRHAVNGPRKNYVSETTFFAIG